MLATTWYSFSWIGFFYIHSFIHSHKFVSSYPAATQWCNNILTVCKWTWKGKCSMWWFFLWLSQLFQLHGFQLQVQTKELLSGVIKTGRVWFIKTSNVALLVFTIIFLNLGIRKASAGPNYVFQQLYALL